MATEAQAAATTDAPAEPAPTAAERPTATMTFDQALQAMARTRETAGTATTPKAAAETESAPDPNHLEDVQDSDDGGSDDAEDADAADAEDGGDEETEESAPEEADESDDDDPLVELQDGSKEPLSKLVSSWQRQAALVKKEQALAGLRKQLEDRLVGQAEVEKSYRDRAERYGLLVDSLDKIVDQEGEQWKKIDWKSLKEDDPHEFLLKREEFREWEDRKRAIDNERKRLSEEQAKEREKVLEDLKGRLRGALSEMFPSWSDNTVMRAETTAMAATAKAVGFSEEEMSATLDPRSWQLLWKAAQYDKLQASKARAKNGSAQPEAAPAADVPRPVRVMKASGPRPSPRTTVAAQVKSLRDKAFKSGSFEDAYQAYTAGRRGRSS